MLRLTTFKLPMQAMQKIDFHISLASYKILLNWRHNAISRCANLLRKWDFCNKYISQYLDKFRSALLVLRQLFQRNDVEHINMFVQFIIVTQVVVSESVSDEPTISTRHRSQVLDISGSTLHRFFLEDLYLDS